MSITHLNIQQNNKIQESVPDNVISDLATLSRTNSLDASSELAGNIRSAYAYGDDISLLNERWPNLTVSCGDELIRFKDSAMEARVKEHLGLDRITKNAALNVTDLGSFQDNTDITSFEELKYFVNVKSCPSFYRCFQLQYVDFSHITTIHQNGCRESGITKVNAPNLLSLGHEAFKDCRSLTEVTNLGEITTIESATFNGCSNLEKVILPETITHIGGNAFIGSYSLKEINFPHSITSLDDKCFYYCPLLKGVAYFPNVINIGFGVFSGDNTSQVCGLRYVYLPKLQKIPAGSYCSWQFQSGFIAADSWGRPAIFNILYFRDINDIGACAFRRGTIRNLVINSSVLPVLTANNGSYQYSNGTNRTDFLIEENTAQNEDMFWDCDGITNIYVPDGAVDNYKAAFASVSDRIKPISQLNQVATEAEFNELSDTEKMDTLIAEYM